MGLQDSWGQAHVAFHSFAPFPVRSHIRHIQTQGKQESVPGETKLPREESKLPQKRGQKSASEPGRPACVRDSLGSGEGDKWAGPGGGAPSPLGMVPTGGSAGERESGWAVTTGERTRVQGHAVRRVQL